jgi:rod shape-determining protein MreB
MSIGSAHKLRDDTDAHIRGRDLVSGLPKDMVIGAQDIREAISDPVSKIIGAIKATLDETPPDLVSDLAVAGIVLAGGGALLRGLPERLRTETGMPVFIAEDPLHAVVNGAGKCVENIALLEAIVPAEKKS